MIFFGSWPPPWWVFVGAGALTIAVAIGVQNPVIAVAFVAIVAILAIARWRGGPSH
jgi:hypothetical protein